MAGAANITERGVDGIAFEKPIPASQPGDTFPAGAILLWGAASPPAGWMICDGSAISRAGFPTLFANYGTTWGAGDGSTTFNIPDYRDKVPVGKSGTKALASSGGAETHSISVSEMPSHNHGGTTSSGGAHTHGPGLGLAFIVQAVSGPNVGTSGTTTVPADTASATASAGTHSHTITSQGSGTAMSLMQPYRAINYIIRAY